MLIRALGSQQETGGQGKSSWKGGQGGGDGGTQSSAITALSLSQELLAGVVFCSEGNVISCICGARKQRETRRGAFIPPPDGHPRLGAWVPELAALCSQQMQALDLLCPLFCGTTWSKFCLALVYGWPPSTSTVPAVVTAR